MEPLTYHDYYIKVIEGYTQPLRVIWWRRLESNQQCREAEDLQSSGVTSFPTSPYRNTLTLT